MRRIVYVKFLIQSKYHSIISHGFCLQGELLAINRIAPWNNARKSIRNSSIISTKKHYESVINTIEKLIRAKYINITFTSSRNIFTVLP